MTRELAYPTKRVIYKEPTDGRLMVSFKSIQLNTGNICLSSRTNTETPSLGKVGFIHSIGPWPLNKFVVTLPAVANALPHSKGQLKPTESYWIKTSPRSCHHRAQMKQFSLQLSEAQQEEVVADLELRRILLGWEIRVNNVWDFQLKGLAVGKRFVKTRSLDMG